MNTLPHYAQKMVETVYGNLDYESVFRFLNFSADKTDDGVERKRISEEIVNYHL